MTKQPEAMRLAENLEMRDFGSLAANNLMDKASAELRRLHEMNVELVEVLKRALARMEEDWTDLDYEYGGSDKLGDIEAAVAKQCPSTKDIRFVRAAIAKATGEQQ